MNSRIKVGDKVVIIKDKMIIKKPFYISKYMEEMLNSGLEFEVQRIKKSDGGKRHYAMLNGWWWPLRYLKHPHANAPLYKEKITNFTFDTNNLVV